VREGEKEWQDLGVDADGKLIAIPRAPSAEAETYLLGKLQHADQVINNHKQRVGYIQHNFKGIVEQAFGTIKTLETQLFPQFADPEATKNNTHIQTMTKTLESRQLNKTPLSSMFTKLYAHSREQQDYIAELEAKVNGGQFAKKDLGLNSSDFSGDGGTGKVLTGDDKPFRMDDFEKIKMGR
jgi:hypothetical protein